MTQAEAKNAVQHIKRNLGNALIAHTMEEMKTKIFDVLLDVDTLAQRLNAKKQAAPNCRPATQAELEQLCQGGNVVMFPALA